MRLLQKSWLINCFVVGMCLLFSVKTSHAAISQQFNQDAAGLGDAQAGSAASAIDASTEFYNPAGLLLIPEQEVILGGNLSMPTYQFSGSTVYNLPPISPPDNFISNISSGESNGGAFSQQLFLHYAAPISNTWAFGFGISSPFAMNSAWSNDSSAAGSSTNTRFSTYDISTDLAYAITSKLSAGLGLDFVRVIVSEADYNGLVGEDYSTSLSGSEWEKAWHGGLLYQFASDVRAGLAYHSKVDYKASGSAQSLDENGAVLHSTNDFVMTSTLPAYTTASIYYTLNPTWALEGSVNYTQWDQADDVTYQNLPSAIGMTESTTQTYAFNNTWRTALGVHYILSPEMVLRTGIGYETSPYQNTDTVYLGAPVGASYDASAGLQYKYSRTLVFDLGWTHMFYLTQDVSTTNATSDSTTSGQFSGSNDILGAQVRWEML
jgi:long-chain fatty acid transport protein